MNIEAIRLFVDVAESGSFANAARKLNRDPSLVSRTIATLESQLKFQLFKRSTRTLSLTEAGERYLHRIKPVLSELEFAVDEARLLNETPSGKLRITASTAFGQICLLPHLAKFYQRYPDIELEIQLTENNLDLFAESIDLACRLTPTFQSDLFGAKLFDTHYLVCASPVYIEKNQNSKSPLLDKPEAIIEHDAVVFNLSAYQSRWKFMGADKAIKEVKISSRLAVSSALALRECLLNDLGPGLVPHWLVEKDLEKGDLVNLFPSYQVTATDFNTGAWLLYPSRKYLPSKTRVMIDYLKSVFT
ncbi:LysR family transcriptional regulator [Marinomonas sp.]|nr:LysR family transcriptional regulator [Marinomonas sp.]MDB4837446.1 LysR family transcriptional regulator [Marinomonas sp.]